MVKLFEENKSIVDNYDEVDGVLGVYKNKVKILFVVVTISFINKFGGFILGIRMYKHHK